MKDLNIDFREGREKRLEKMMGKRFERRMRKGIGEKDRNRDWSGRRERDQRL